MLGTYILLTLILFFVALIWHADTKHKQNMLQTRDCYDRINHLARGYRNGVIALHKAHYELGLNMDQRLYDRFMDEAHALYEADAAKIYKTLPQGTAYTIKGLDLPTHAPGISTQYYGEL